MSTILAAVFLLASQAMQAGGQHVSYEISFPNLVHHEAEVQVTFHGVPADRPLEVRMSRTSPGRYALHEFAKNVYNVRVDDGSGPPLPVSRPDLHGWDVTEHEGTVRISYTLFGDRADGTYNGINNRYVHLNAPATFMWARGTQEFPVTVVFRLPRDGWDIATQLFPDGDSGSYTAPDFWYLMDSPVHIGPISWSSWEVQEAERTYTIRLALNHQGSPEDAAHYADLARKVVDEQIAMWGDVPDFDTGTYTFIAAYLPSVAGDGMEHRNSTVLTYPKGFSAGTIDFSDAWLDPLGTLSHEFFHAWNVERMRPRSLEPFDFEAANVSGELWFAEGFTSYYDGLFLKRAGLITVDEFAANLSRPVETVLNSPGRQLYSAVEMSMQAPFVDAATSVDPVNRRNTFISYYVGGDALALGLDLLLRRDFDRTLNDYMRAMWARHGRTEIPYTLSDLEMVLGELTGAADFARDYFERFVEGHDVVAYDTLLSQAGFAVRKKNPGKPWLGADLADASPSGVLVAEEPLIGSPLYRAGLDAGSRIVELGGRSVDDARSVRRALERREAGDAVAVRYVQNGEALDGELAWAEDPTVEVVTYESVGREVTPQMRGFRERWLGSRAAGRSASCAASPPERHPNRR